MATSAAVRGASLLTNFWKAVEEEILAAGGTEETLGMLVTKKLRPAIARFAADAVAITKTIAVSFAEQIRAGKFKYLYGFASNPEAIRGQTAHSVTNETELDHPGTPLTTPQIWERYGDKMASLSEFLDFAAKNPTEYWIGIVWKDETSQFWYADVDRDGSDRDLDVNQDGPDGRWDGYYRFLRRK